MMDKPKKILMELISFFRKNYFVVFAVAVYLFFTVFYMGFSQTISDCNNTLNGFGDNTTGPIWREANAGDSPVGGFSKVTNYPIGESLNSPVNTVVIGQTLLLWTTSKIVGPVCGYNLVNILGYMSSALVMFAFIYSLTKGRRWIALLAGYAIAFAPYFQVKVGVHPGYGFQALLIGIVWSFWSLVTTRKMSKAVLLAGLLAVCFYFDPYFSLFALTIIVPFGLVWLISNLIKIKKDKRNWLSFLSELKVLLFSLFVFLVFLSPFLYIMVTQSTQISSTVAGTREDVIEVARQYSNMPSEYFVPYINGAIYKSLGQYGQEIYNSLYVYSNGNIFEDTVGISLIMMLVVALFFVVVVWEKLRHKSLGISKLIRWDAPLVIVSVSALAVTAVILALPPVCIFGIPSPSYILLHTTSIWRIISREYVVINMAIVILFSVALVFFDKKLTIKWSKKLIIFFLLFFSIFVQYQIFTPFQGFESEKSKYSDAPTGYYWLKEQKDITAVAEYPLEKVNYYISMQIVHKKSLLNSTILNSQDDPIRSSIKNLSDPQTISVLHSLGINAIIIHGVNPADIEKVPYLKVVFIGNHGTKTKGPPHIPEPIQDIFVIAKISDDTPIANTSIRFLNNLPRNNQVQTSAIDWQYDIPSGSKIAVGELPNRGDVTGTSEMCFMIKMGAFDSGLLTVEGDGSKTSMAINIHYLS